MKNKLLRLFAWGLFLFTAITACEKTEHEEYDFELVFFTENYAPFNYEDDGTIEGLAPRLLDEIAKELGFVPETV